MERGKDHPICRSFVCVVSCFWGHFSGRVRGYEGENAFDPLFAFSTSVGRSDSALSLVINKNKSNLSLIRKHRCGVKLNQVFKIK